MMEKRIALFFSHTLAKYAIKSDNISKINNKITIRYVFYNANYIYIYIFLNVILCFN